MTGNMLMQCLRCFMQIVLTAGGVAVLLAIFRRPLNASRAGRSNYVATDGTAGRRPIPSSFPNS
jgi:hypothetical protein